MAAGQSFLAGSYLLMAEEEATGHLLGGSWLFSRGLGLLRAPGHTCNGLRQACGTEDPPLRAASPQPPPRTKPAKGRPPPRAERKSGGAKTSQGGAAPRTHRPSPRRPRPSHLASWGGSYLGAPPLLGPGLPLIGCQPVKSGARLAPGTAQWTRRAAMFGPGAAR